MIMKTDNSAEIDKNKHMMRIEGTKNGRIYDHRRIDDHELIQFIIRTTSDDERNS